MNLKNAKTAKPVLLSILLIFSVMQAYALSSDRQKPLNIKAQKVFIDDKTGFSVYEGNVIVIQGTMKITANKLTVIHDDKQNLKQIIAEGLPSTYKQRPDNKNKDIEAIANKMVYFAQKELMVMTDNASIIQGGNKFNSNKIFYYLAEDRVKTGTMSSTTDSAQNKSEQTNKNQRVNIILEKEKKNK